MPPTHPAGRRRALRAVVNAAILAAILVGIRAAATDGAAREPAAAGDDAGGGSTAAAAGGAVPSDAEIVAPTSREAREAALASRPPAVESEADIEGIEDPAILYRAAAVHRSRGDLELARRCVEAGLQREELNHYLDLTRWDAYRALVHERMGEPEQADAAWADGVEHDLHYTYLLCRLLSEDPGKERRLDAMRQELLRRLEAARSGEVVHWYTTRKGASRTLEVIDADELVRRARAVAEGRGRSIRYVYVPELDLAALPADLPIKMTRSVIGSLRGYGAERTAQLGFSGFIVDEMHLGKKWLGAVNRSTALPPAVLDEVFIVESVILADAHLESARFTGRNASFVFDAFEGEADLSAMDVAQTADFRYASFARGVNLRRAVFHGPVHFGHTSYGGGVDFGTVVCATRRAHFNSARFGGPALFEGVDFRQGGTFEDSTFDGPLVITRGRFGARTNLSRCTFSDGIRAREVVSRGMDFFGSVLDGSSDFTDSVFDGHVRFSLDEVTYRDFAGRVDDLHALYKVYQGDEDATEDLTTRSAYGVEHVDDLTAYIPGEVTFANAMFQEFCQFQRVVFGESGVAGTASFYNAQFRGETHFERAVFHYDADFTTIFANELGLNEATFHGRLMLDDANVPGRVTLGGATLVDGADLSLYGAQIARFHISKAQLEERRGRHRLFYERCAQGRVDAVEDDPRIARALAGTRPGEEPPDVTDLCYERLAEDFNVLGNAFAERGMPADEDWAYWYGRHHETMHDLLHGTAGARLSAFFRWFLFELLFGWGVRLQNLALAALLVVVVFGLAYKWLTPDAEIVFNGFETRFRHLSYVQAIFLSLMSLMSMDIGWDIGRNRFFRWLNVVEVLLGVLIMTFFVGAYTRLVLA